MGQRERLTADREGGLAAEGERRPDRFIPTARHGLLLVVACGQAVAAQVLAQLVDERLGGDDARLAAARPHVHQRPGAPGMVGVVVRVHDRMQRLVADLLQRFAQRRSGRRIARVDQHQALVGLEHRNVDERQAQQPGARTVRFDLELGASVGNRRRVGTAVHVVGNGLRELAAEAAAARDGAHQRRVLAGHRGARGGQLGRVGVAQRVLLVVVRRYAGSGQRQHQHGSERTTAQDR